MFIPNLQQNQTFLNQENLLHRITKRILQSPELQDILTATVIEVRLFLNSDRVKICKFHADGSAQVVAESIQGECLPSLLGLSFPADDIPPHARELLIHSRMRSIVHVSSQQIGQSLLRSNGGDPTAFDQVYYRPLDPYDAEYLMALGVESSLMVPIFEQGQLWGLLVSHHIEPRSIQEPELQSMQMVVDQLEVAIIQNSLLLQARRQANREAVVNQIGALLHSSPTIELQAALETTVKALGGSAGRLAIHPITWSSLARVSVSELPANMIPPDDFRLYTCGQQPSMPAGAVLTSIELSTIWQEYFTVSDHNIWAIANLYEIPMLQNLQSAFQGTPIRGILVAPLQYRQQLLGYLSIFRDEIATETLGIRQFDPDQHQGKTHASFEVWRESKKGQADLWSEEDIELFKELANQFAMAIQQYETYQLLQNLNARLEQQIQERTAQVQKALADLQYAQTQLIQTEKMSSLGQLVAGIAHEINNPVSFIYGNLSHTRAYTQNLLKLLQVYQEHYPEPQVEVSNLLQEIDLPFLAQDLPKVLSSMKLGADRIRQIVLSLRNFSRLDQAEMKPVDIHEGIESTLMVLHHRLKPKPGIPTIQLVKEYSFLPTVECYASELNQVFMNVLSNAIDALEELMSDSSITHQCLTPRIRIRTQVIGNDCIAIRIDDNGPGIPETVRTRIFDPFFTTKSIGKGTGLGLSISYQIVVEKHRGVFRCNSQPGEGTEFEIEIPVRATR